MTTMSNLQMSCLSTFLSDAREFHDFLHFFLSCAFHRLEHLSSSGTHNRKIASGKSANSGNGSTRKHWRSVVAPNVAAKEPSCKQQKHQKQPHESRGKKLQETANCFCHQFFLLCSGPVVASSNFREFNWLVWSSVFFQSQSTGITVPVFFAIANGGTRNLHR
jgi:hypothetical protein